VADPARAAAAHSAAEAFARIAASRAPFVSRGDSSGTHVKELALWKAAGVTPGEREPWYVQAGVDQAGTLRIADERQAYALADLPTFTRLGDLSLRLLFASDTALANPYTLYVVRSTSTAPAPAPGAARFAAWALTEWRARLLALRLPGGAAAFAPLPGGCTSPVAAP
jgi:tungstate transport system substrate-binding protein